MNRPSARSDTRRTTGHDWRKSSYSGPTGGNCVETATRAAGGVAVRDSRAPAGPALAFTPSAWAAFVNRCRSAVTG